MEAKQTNRSILTIRTFLGLAGLDITKRIKLVRHKDSRDAITINGKTVVGDPYDWYLNDRETFIAYQSEQHKDIFKDVDYVVSFIGEDGTLARMVGVYQIIGRDTERENLTGGGKYCYKMVEVDGFDELNERVIVDWGDSARTFHQWLDKNDKIIVAVERKGFDWVCPDYEEISLTYGELSHVINESLDAWKRKLTVVNGIYVISDRKTGKLYVGSTYNRDGIWGRWEDYARTGHGGDVKLANLIAEAPDYAKDNFVWSILQTLPLNVSDIEAIRVETLWKNKLGRSVCSLNRN